MDNTTQIIKEIEEITGETVEDMGLQDEVDEVEEAENI